MESPSMSIPPDPKRGEIWRVDLNPTQGAEMSKIRPAVVINSSTVGRLPLRLIVPVTTWDVRYTSYSWMVRLDPDASNGLSRPSTADAFQIRSVSLDRFMDRLGVLADDVTDQIAAAVALCVDAL
ncbi:MAG TPA: type II toxin-antitoxin system PemK/MazF family toxin [Chthonomonadaceae bacterium]|nr:type II toxin-antitoxin system PemK/MazF family toxin [Chthonomonadaceae bacterium]